MDDLDVSGTMNKNTLPLLVQFGKHTAFFSSAEQESTFALVPKAKKHIFEKSAHCPFWEEPENFKRILREFVNSMDPESSSG